MIKCHRTKINKEEQKKKNRTEIKLVPSVCEIKKLFPQTSIFSKCPQAWTLPAKFIHILPAYAGMHFRLTFHESHNENTPMSYNAVFHGCKNDDLR